MRAESLSSRYRQKPWVSMAKIFEVEDLISRADGELSGPIVLVSPRALGINEKSQLLNQLDGFF